MGKEGYYALGGTALGAVAGYVFGKGSGAKISVPEDIAAEVAKLTAFDLPPEAAALPLEIRPIWNYVVDIPAVMYALIYNGLGNTDNPEATMCVAIRDNLVFFEFGMHAAVDVVVYRGTTQLILLPASLFRGVTVPRG